MKIINILLYIGLIIISFSCSKKENSNSGNIKADISNVAKDFDKVVIEMHGFEFLGDSTAISDTMKANNGKFEYNFKVKEPKTTFFWLLKNNKRIGTLSFRDKENKKTLWGNVLLGNENIKITSDTAYGKSIYQNMINYTVDLDGSQEAKMSMKTNLKKIVSDVIIKQQPSSYALLYQLYNYRDDYSISYLNKLSSLFSGEIKKSKSYSVLQNYITNRISLNERGYRDNFNWTDVNRKNYSFEEARDGKQMMLFVFWASWCGPCRAEIPNLKKFHDKYGDKVSVVSLSIDDNYNNWKKAIEKEKMPWLNLSNLPIIKNRISTQYNISTVPNLILLDKNGKTIVNTINDLPQIIEIVDTHLE